MDATLLIGAAAAGAAWVVSKVRGTPTQDALVNQALPLAVQQVDAGVPPAQAAQSAATAVVGSMTQQAVDIAAQQMASGVPADQASRIAANAVVDATTAPAAPSTPAAAQMNVEGDPKAGPYYVFWLMSPYSQPWVHYFATKAEADSYAQFLPMVNSASAMASHIMVGGPDVKSVDFVPGSPAPTMSIDTEEALTQKATVVAAQQISAGVPSDQAAQNAAEIVVEAAKQPPTPVATAPQVAPPPPSPALVAPMPRKTFLAPITLWNRISPLRR
jgi:hypothetical protein